MAVQKTPLFGIYNVEKFIRNKDTLLPLATDTAQWKTVNISFANGANIKMMNDSMYYYSFSPDTLKKTIKFYTYGDTAHKSLLSYSNPDSAHLIITGKLKDDSVYIKMKKVDFNKLMLTGRGFHWINEYPYNH